MDNLFVIKFSDQSMTQLQNLKNMHPQNQTAANHVIEAINYCYQIYSIRQNDPSARIRFIGDSLKGFMDETVIQKCSTHLSAYLPHHVIAQLRFLKKTVYSLSPSQIINIAINYYYQFKMAQINDHSVETALTGPRTWGYLSDLMEDIPQCL